MAYNKTFKLQVVTVSNALFDGEATELRCRGSAGQLTILAHHQPLITRVDPSDIIVVSESGEEKFAISGGILEVADNRAVVLCSSDDGQKVSA